MELSYVKKETYEILCDPKGYCACCNIISTIEIYGDKVFLVSTNTERQIKLDEMKKIISELKD